jgi:hypothetical protein
VHEEPANALRCGQSYDLQSVAALNAVILPVERHGLGIGADEAAVRDCHPVRVSAAIGQNSFGAAEGWFGIDHPFGFAERGQPFGKGISVRKSGQITEEGKFSCSVQRDQPFNEQPTE